jgi:hypothetical protein
MYTLRIITQVNNGAEERRNILFDKEYSILMRVPSREDEIIMEGNNRFVKALLEFYAPGEDIIDQTIIGFVYVNNKTYAIHDYQVFYIVSDEGKTVERIYGTYNKH